MGKRIDGAGANGCGGGRVGSSEVGLSGGSGGRDAVASGILLGLFTLWTVVVCTVDVQPAGPNGSEVGLATLNVAFREFTGEHMALYFATDYLSIIPITVMFGFGLLGLAQLVSRKSLVAVDRDLLALGVFYVVLLVTYIAFDAIALNYRPLLIEGRLEPSYPSSTTLLVFCVMTTAAMQLNRRMGEGFVKKALLAAVVTFAAFMIVARLFSGVHWISDIVGGILLGGCFVMAYRAFSFGGPTS
ncbi:MAG: phosphatase PAP2 family protein [Eggerthellaceae bacterium]|nr:phosphatase PAP2 family protein [Eggerthellaceae bacterium]